MPQENFQVDDCKDYSRIKLPEKVTALDGEFFNSALEIAYEHGHNRIVIDCSDLKIFNTASLVYLIVYINKVNSNNGELKMINVLDNSVREKFQSLSLHKLISISY